MILLAHFHDTSMILLCTKIEKYHRSEHIYSQHITSKYSSRNDTLILFLQKNFPRIRSIRHHQHYFTPFIDKAMRLRFKSTSATRTITCSCSFTTSDGSLMYRLDIWDT